MIYFCPLFSTLTGNLLYTKSFIRDLALAKISGKVGKDIIFEFSAQWSNFTILTYWLAKPFQFLVNTKRYRN